MAPHGGLAAVIEKVRGLADILGVHDALFEAEFDLIAREWGIENCSVWTINAPALMRKWIDIGPGFIVSDDPVTLKSLLRQEEVA